MGGGAVGKTKSRHTPSYLWGLSSDSFMVKVQATLADISGICTWPFYTKGWKMLKAWVLLLNGEVVLEWHSIISDIHMYV